MRLSLLLFLCLFSLFAEEKVSTHADYTATVGTGEVSFIAYTKAGGNRPITFAFNGGPGSSSVWLHMGAFGPRRVLTHEEGQSIVPPYKIVDNPDSILDLTDIVFIDPMGTGFSQAKDKETEKEHYSIRGDIKAVGNFIQGYLTANRRWNSPKYLAGESYGAMRAAGLADYLHNEYGIFLNGVIFISPALDYQTLVFENDNQLPYALFLPTYATTAWYHDRYRPGATMEEVAEEARHFAFEIYAPSLICRKCYDPEPIDEQLAEMTGLPLQTIKRNGGRISDLVFSSELLADERKIIGRFDSRYSGSVSPSSQDQDPSSALIEGIFAGAFHDYLQGELGCPNSYRLLSMEVHEKWNYGNTSWGYPSLMNSLRRALITNPTMKVFAACGYFDLATPFAATEYSFDHLDVPHVSVQMEYYEGGHMYYLNPSARTKFKQDLIRFYQGNP